MNVKWWWLVAAVVAALALGVSAMVALRSDDAGSADSTGHRAAAERSAPSSPGSIPPARPVTPATSPSASPAAGASSAAGSPGRIRTASSSYFGRPFETIQISGRYRGVDGSRRLRLQVRRPNGWSRMPLPVVTRPSGAFKAYVELDFGRHRLRLVDPRSGSSSRILTVLVF
jgi:hypothetical protein